MEQTIEKLERAVRSIWTEEPAEIAALKRVQGGCRETAPVFVYLESETRECSEFLWLFRQSVVNGRLSLDEGRLLVSDVLEYKASKWERWYKLTTSCGILLEAAQAFARPLTMEEFIRMVDAIRHYVGRFNFWLDAVLPWDGICKAEGWQFPALRSVNSRSVVEEARQ